MTARVPFGIAVAASLFLLTVSPTFAAPPALRGIAFDERLDSESLPADLPPAVPVIARIALDLTALTGDAASAALDRLQSRLDGYRRRSVPVILAIPTLPSDDVAVEAWRVALRSIADRGRGIVAAFEIGEAASASSLPDVNRYVYLLKLAAVQIRSVDADALVVQGSVVPDAVDWERHVLAAGTAPYVDGVALAAPAGDIADSYRAAVQRFAAALEQDHPTAVVLVGPVHLASESAAAATLIETQLRTLGTRIQVTTYAGAPASIKAALTAAVRLGDLIAGNLVPIDERAANLRITRGGVDVTASVPHRMLYSVTGLSTYLLYWSGSSTSPLDIAVDVANASAPMVRDPLAGTAQKPIAFDAGAHGKGQHLTVPAAAHALLVDFNFGASDTYVQTTEVEQATLPRVEEIVARFQQVQAAQDAALKNYVANVRMEQHFHPSAADASYNIITENRLYSDRNGVEWEELSFEMNGAKWTSNRPAFPLLQPEKVLSLPLDLRLNQDYTYRLDGVDTVNGRPAFVVRFDPVDAAHALYRGTVWIDRQTFVRLRVRAVETKLSGAIVSNDETQVFEPVGDVDRRPIWLMGRLISKQIFLIAGRTVLVERDVHLRDFALNVDTFDSERAGARAGNRIMYRDTEQGVRYLVKKGETRVVSEQMTTSARAFAMGADIDPSLVYPLPIGGLDILDFNFLNKDMQLALLWGGPLVAGNIQRPNLFGGKFDASLDFFALAIKSSDDVFGATGRRAGERVNRIPASTGVNLGYQMTPFQKVTSHYELHYDAYFSDAATASGFTVPANGFTNGEGLGYEYRRRGYSFQANAMAYQRATWSPWGVGPFDSEARTYTKYDLGLSKDFIFATFHTIHLNGTYFGGQRLDRFSMYQFGLFDATRMHGVPSAVRLGELGMFRGSYSFNLFDQYRLDLFLDRATGRDVTGDRQWRPVTGTGVRVNFRTPWSTLLQVDVGKSFLPDVYRGVGSTVLQILLLKPL